MSKHLCDSCGKKIVSQKGARILTPEKVYLFCRKCLREARKRLKAIPNRTLEVEELLIQLEE